MSSFASTASTISQSPPSILSQSPSVTGQNTPGLFSSKMGGRRRRKSQHKRGGRKNKSRKGGRKSRKNRK